MTAIISLGLSIITVVRGSPGRLEVVTLKHLANVVKTIGWQLWVAREQKIISVAKQCQGPLGGQVFHGEGVSVRKGVRPPRSAFWRWGRWGQTPAGGLTPRYASRGNFARCFPRRRFGFPIRFAASVSRSHRFPGTARRACGSLALVPRCAPSGSSGCETPPARKAMVRREGAHGARLKVGE